MGLDAVVRCTCFARGLTSPPPVPITLDEGGFPDFDFDPDSESGRRDYERYLAWEESCCAHPGLVYATERIGSWSAYAAFHAAILQAWDQFPTLARELPHDNSGETAPPAAAAALRELALFRGLDQVGEDTVLVDTATNEVLCGRAEIGGYLGGDRESRIMLAKRDVVICDKDSEVEVFRARQLRQVVRERDSSGRPVAVVFTNLDTGKTHVGTYPIGMGPRWECPDLLHVERRPMRPEEFDETLESLERIFRASVATGNPVEWC